MKKEKKKKKSTLSAIEENVIWGCFSKNGTDRVDFYNYFKWVYYIILVSILTLEYKHESRKLILLILLACLIYYI